MMEDKVVPKGQRYVRDFIIYSAMSIPAVNLDDYSLVVDGLVNNPLRLSFSDLEKMADSDYVKDFHCVTKWSVENVRWTGVKFTTLAELVKVKEDASWVMFHCLDGYTTPVPLEDAMDPGSVIAIKMNDKPIPRENGYPVRPFIPHLYGWKSAKWLNRIEFISEYRDGYWEFYGYHERGNIWEEERFKGSDWKKIKRTVFRKE